MKEKNPGMTAKEVEHLSWIHSNKFTTADLFYKKFLPEQTPRNSYYILNKYTKPEKGFLEIQKLSVNNSSVFFLTASAIRALDAEDKILVRNPKYPVKINPFEKNHDLSVQDIRIAFESNEDLGNVYWISDFEMRSGITLPIKVAFEAGELDRERWRRNWINIHIRGRRTPDGYFEADMDGQMTSFALEFENHPYNDTMVNRMVGYLDHSFPDALRLVVSAKSKNAVRMIHALRAKIKESERHRWFVSDFEKATTLPFKKIWHQVNHPVI